MTQPLVKVNERERLALHYRGVRERLGGGSRHKVTPVNRCFLVETPKQKLLSDPALKDFLPSFRATAIEVALKYDIPLKILKTRGHRLKYAKPRAEFVYRLYVDVPLKTMVIARGLNKDHATVNHLITMHALTNGLPDPIKRDPSKSPKKAGA